MARLQARLTLVAALLAACAKGDPDPSAADAGLDASSCRDNECEYQGACILPTVCHPVFPGQVCADGAWLDTCGNGNCDCGEGPTACGQDCQCNGDTCSDDGSCVAPGTCQSDGSLNLCRAGTFVPSCGDDACNCGEALETCARDCPPEGPFWSDCQARSGQWDSCSEYCASLELRCADSCTTTRDRPNWGAESWPEGEECGGVGNAEALCTDLWGDRIGAEPHWRCCCAP